MSADPTRIDGQTIKTRPAGSIYPETEWSIPGNDYVQSWLGEARAKFREHQHARAIGRVMEAHTMQRIIRLVMRIDTDRDYADALRQQRDDAIRERDEYRASAVALRQELDAANAEIGRLNYAYKSTNQVLDGQGKVLEKSLDYLAKVRAVLDEADYDLNITGDQDPDGAPDAPDGHA
jgi:hypothetical protein